jgi:hypothetical protein
VRFSDAEAEQLAGLDPVFIPAVLEHRRLCLAAGIPWTLESGRRSTDFQRILYEHPDLHPGSPAAAPGTSYHELGFAYDAGGSRNTLQRVTFGSLAEQLGLVWGGRFSTPDWNHVQHASSRPDLAAYVRVRWGGGVA